MLFAKADSPEGLECVFVLHKSRCFRLLDSGCCYLCLKDCRIAKLAPSSDSSRSARDWLHTNGATRAVLFLRELYQKLYFKPHLVLVCAILSLFVKKVVHTQYLVQTSIKVNHVQGNTRESERE